MTFLRKYALLTLSVDVTSDVVYYLGGIAAVMLLSCE